MKRASARALIAAAAIAAGCTAMQTVVDTMRARPLTAQPFHIELNLKSQCMHCHRELAEAPAVPHPHYKKCIACHQTAD